MNPETILEGCSVRISIPVPDELTDGAEERAAKQIRRDSGERKWTPWKKIKGWKISQLMYKELGSVWTDNHEYKL